MSFLHALATARSAFATALVCLSLSHTAHSQPIPSETKLPVADPTNSVSGPVRLRQPVPRPDPAPAERESRIEAPPREAPPEPGEFERFVQGQVGPDTIIRRFGIELLSGQGQDLQDADVSPLTPSDYVVGPGDEIVVTLWGSIDADLRVVVDRTGRISIPRVGVVKLAGVRHGDLQETVNRRVAQVFRNFESSVTLGQLRGIRVFVTGFVRRPGSYTVSSLATAVGALIRAGGPSAAGSFRDIDIVRAGTSVGRIDLYDLLLKGDRSGDRTLQAGDVVHVGPVGVQVGMIGSVNKPAIFELKPSETTASVLQMAGGFTAVADRSRVAIERLSARNSGRVEQLNLPADAGAPLNNGDVLRAFSAVSALLPQGKQAKRVTVEGEVARPGEYVLPEASSVRDAIRAAGGFAPGAYLYATELTRPSVQRTQQANYERALRDMETDLARSSGSQRIGSAEDASSLASRNASADRLLNRLRAVRPTGRIVLEIGPDATDLPDMALEDGDRLTIPARPTTVGVFGSVFNAAAYLHAPSRTIGDYLRLGGGPTKGADEDSIFIVRANGSVISSRQQSVGWFSRSGGLESLQAQPGDTVFVPEEMDKTTFMQSAKDWTQLLYQFGLGIAGLKSATR